VRVAALVALVLAAAVAVVPGTARGTVSKGTIRVGEGGAGVTLGMTRAQVVARLGKPRYQNRNGFLEYARFPNAFDVYLDIGTTPQRVRLIGISGERFCFSKRFCMYDKGAVGKLRARYGDALRVVTLEDGERIYRLSGTFRGCPTFTDFTPARFRASARILMVFIGFESGSAC
jgi:hypothetical protein